MGFFRLKLKIFESEKNKKDQNIQRLKVGMGYAAVDKLSFQYFIAMKTD